MRGRNSIRENNPSCTIYNEANHVNVSLISIINHLLTFIYEPNYLTTNNYIEEVFGIKSTNEYIDIRKGVSE